MARNSSIEPQNALHKNTSMGKQSANQIKPTNSQYMTSAAQDNKLMHESPTKLLLNQGDSNKHRFGGQVKKYMQNGQINTSLSLVRHRSREAIIYNKLQSKPKSDRDEDNNTFGNRNKSVPNKSQKAAFNRFKPVLSPHANHEYENRRDSLLFPQSKQHVDLQMVAAGELSHRQLTNNTNNKHHVMRQLPYLDMIRQLHHSHYSYHLQTSLLKINNEINNSCSLRNNSLESFNEHEHDSRSCCLLHMEESTLM